MYVTIGVVCATGCVVRVAVYNGFGFIFSVCCGNQDRIRLQDLQVITLHHGQYTSARRSHAVPQVVGILMFCTVSMCILRKNKQIELHSTICTSTVNFQMKWDSYKCCCCKLALHVINLRLEVSVRKVTAMLYSVCCCSYSEAAK
jgi:SOCE-associated regulatory factor of calcium homoeostasis